MNPTHAHTTESPPLAKGQVSSSRPRGLVLSRPTRRPRARKRSRDRVGGPAQPRAPPTHLYLGGPPHPTPTPTRPPTRPRPPFSTLVPHCRTCQGVARGAWPSAWRLTPFPHPSFHPLQRSITPHTRSVSSSLSLFGGGGTGPAPTPHGPHARTPFCPVATRSRGTSRPGSAGGVSSAPRSQPHSPTRHTHTGALSFLSLCVCFKDPEPKERERQEAAPSQTHTQTSCCAQAPFPKPTPNTHLQP